jgi:poly(A) polymerase
LLGIPLKDIDFATTALPQAVMEHLQSHHIVVKPIGIEHGTVMAVLEGHSFEITTLRQDVACDGRHAEVRFTDNWRTDAARRDFTINAMSVDKEGVIYDYFGGQQDLAHRFIRFVGTPALRIQEDYLRILRYFRFMARFGFTALDEETNTACTHFAPALTSLSAERIGGEMLALFAAPNPSYALAMMMQLHILPVICPFALSHSVSFDALVALEQACSFPINPLLRIAFWLRQILPSPHIETEIASLATSWKMANAQKDLLHFLVTSSLLPWDQPFTYFRQQIRKVGKAKFELLLLLSYAMQDAVVTTSHLVTLLRDIAAWSVPRFPVSGDDLCNQFSMVEGPTLGAFKTQLEAWWEHNNYPSKEAVLQYAAQLLEQS